MFRRYRKAVLLLLLILQSCQEMMMIPQHIVHLLQLCTPMRRRKVRSVHFHRYHNVIISRVCVFGIEFAVNVLVCCKDIISQFSCTNNFVAVLRYRLDIIYC